MRATLAVVLLTVLSAQPASAASVSQSGGLVTYQTAGGEVNQTTPFAKNGRVHVREANPATALSAGRGCQIVSDRLAECGSADSVRINLGDGDDTYFGTGAGFFSVTVSGETGNDRFIDGDGASHREVYIGGT